MNIPGIGEHKDSIPLSGQSEEVQTYINNLDSSLEVTSERVEQFCKSRNGVNVYRILKQCYNDTSKNIIIVIYYRYEDLPKSIFYKKIKNKYCEIIDTNA